MKTAAQSRARPDGLRVIQFLLGLAVAISIVHYTDNYFNYDDFPEPTSGPAPSQGVVGASWFAFTAFGVAGLLLFMRERIAAGAACLAVYSLSGLVGIGHYTVPGATDMPWWRQLHVGADIASGAAILAFAVWAIRRNKARTLAVQ